MCVGAGSIVLSWLLAVLLTVGIALKLDLLGCSMSWFTHSTLILGLYACPATALILAFHNALAKTRFLVSAQ